MITITVELKDRSYPIYIGSGILGRAGILDPHLKGRDVVVVTTPVVGSLYLGRLRGMLPRNRVEVVELPDGEDHKHLATLGIILDALVMGRFGRDCVVVALGGGVVGDMAGFAAAIYQRGVDLIQVPTTLLAQVDSAVGGKTGVNHPGGKNLIGAFHQPLAVLTDSETLETLPDRELSAGLAEVVKYGLMADAHLFAWLEEHAEALLDRDQSALHHVIRRSCEIKAEVVAGDEHEHGRRALLNLGHTFGHAIEQCLGYGKWLHGEAVAAGMCMAADFSTRAGLLPSAVGARLRTLLRRLNLPVEPPALKRTAFEVSLALDKKVLAGQIRLVLLTGVGSARVTADYPLTVFGDWLRESFPD